MMLPVGTNMASKFGRFVSDSSGKVRRVPQLPTPSEMFSPADASPVIGPTRIGEWLLVDVRVARAVPHGTKLHALCQELSRRHGCGVDSETLIIDLLDVRDNDDRTFLLDVSNWPAAS